MPSQKPTFEQWCLENNPDLLKEWHPTKNGERTPSNTRLGQKFKPWWICPLGHEWQQEISKRTYGWSCPYCAGRRAAPGVNDFASLYWKEAKEWFYEMNGDLTPDRVTRRSTKSVYWKCAYCGQVWQCTVRERAHGKQCPSCGGWKTHEKVPEDYEMWNRN